MSIPVTNTTTTTTTGGTGAGAGIGTDASYCLSNALLTDHTDQDLFDQYRIQDTNLHHCHSSSSSSSPTFSSPYRERTQQPSPNNTNHNHVITDVVEIKITAFRNAIVAVKLILG